MEYTFCVIAVLVQFLTAGMICITKNKDNRALRVPYLYISAAYLAIQFFVFIRYCVWMSQKDALIIQTLIFSAFVLAVTVFALGNKYIKRVDRDEKAAVCEFRNIIQCLELKRVELRGGDSAVYLNKLYDKARYSDPSNHGEAIAEDERLLKIIESIDSNMSAEEIASICDEALKLLEMRNIKIRSKK